MNNEQNNGTSTPNAIAPATDTVVVAFEFPRVQDVTERAVLPFGERQEVLRVSDNETVSIDSYFFTGPKVLKLKKIKPALSGIKKAGFRLPDGTEYGQAWFNTNVRDPFHKVLRYAARQSLEHGKPVSVGFTRRTNKATGEQTVTAKHGFEFMVKPPSPASVAASAVKALADQAKANEAAATAQSTTRARRQGNAKPKKSKPLTPVITQEQANAIDAEIARVAAEKAASNCAPAVPTPEPATK